MFNKREIKWKLSIAKRNQRTKNPGKAKTIHRFIGGVKKFNWDKFYKFSFVFNDTKLRVNINRKIMKINNKTFTYLYASSLTLILPATPVVSVLLVKFTALPVFSKHWWLKREMKHNDKQKENGKETYQTNNNVAFDCQSHR